MFWKKYRYEIYGILFTAAAGTLLHFVYEWSGSAVIVGLFAPVNESVWEHIKLLFFPGLLFSIWDYFHASHRPASFLPARTAGLTAGMAAIPLLFYAYTALLGTNHLALDIMVFLLGILLAFLISTLLEKKISTTATTLSGTKTPRAAVSQRRSSHYLPAAVLPLHLPAAAAALIPGSGFRSF